MLRQASSGLTGIEFARLPHNSRTQHIDDLKEVVDDLFQKHPDAFLSRAVNQWKVSKRQRENAQGVNHGE
jgi:hypothetical protein